MATQNNSKPTSTKDDTAQTKNTRNNTKEASVSNGVDGFITNTLKVYSEKMNAVGGVTPATVDEQQYALYNALNTIFKSDANDFPRRLNLLLDAVEEMLKSEDGAFVGNRPMRGLTRAKNIKNIVEYCNMLSFLQVVAPKKTRRTALKSISLSKVSEFLPEAARGRFQQFFKSQR